MKTKCTLAGLLMLCLSFGVFAQTKSKKMTPVEYNNQMAAITDSLYNMGRSWGTRFSEIYNGDKNFSVLAPIRKQMSLFITRTIERVKKQPLAGKDAQGLQSAVVSFLNFENDMVTKAFGRIEALSSSSSEEDIQAAIKNLTDMASAEGDVLKKVNAAQEDYGSKNGFTIEAPDSQEDGNE